MVQTRAFLEYVGNRRWRKLRKANALTGKLSLVYLGNRKWKKRELRASSMSN
jgi:hypothetical protein